MWTLHQVSMDFEFGTVDQGEMTNEEFAAKRKVQDNMDHFFVGSDFTATTIVVVMGDINVLHYGI